MQQLIDLLKTMPEYAAMVQTLKQSQSVAVTGIGQINRSHMIAGLHQHTQRPIVVICQDDLAAKRMQAELLAFLGSNAPILPNRELTLYDSAVVSRSWEQKRLRQLYDLCIGTTDLQIFSWEAMSRRTLPKQLLLDTAFSLETGREYQLSALITRLTQLRAKRRAKFSRSLTKRLVPVLKASASLAPKPTTGCSCSDS